MKPEMRTPQASLDALANAINIGVLVYVMSVVVPPLARWLSS